MQTGRSATEYVPVGGVRFAVEEMSLGSALGVQRGEMFTQGAMNLTACGGCLL